MNKKKIVNIKTKKSIFLEIFNLNNNKETINKINKIKIDFQKDIKDMHKFIKSFGYKPNSKLYLGVIDKFLDFKTVKVIKKHMIKVSQINKQFFKYNSFLVEIADNVDFNNIKLSKMCLFFFVSRKISKCKQACVYRFII